MKAKMKGLDKLSVFASREAQVINQQEYHKPAWFETLWGKTPSPKPQSKDIEMG